MKMMRKVVSMMAAYATIIFVSQVTMRAADPNDPGWSIAIGINFVGDSVSSVSLIPGIHQGVVDVGDFHGSTEGYIDIPISIRRPFNPSEIYNKSELNVGFHGKIPTVEVPHFKFPFEGEVGIVVPFNTFKPAIKVKLELNSDPDFLSVWGLHVQVPVLEFEYRTDNGMYKRLLGLELKLFSNDKLSDENKIVFDKAQWTVDINTPVPDQTVTAPLLASACGLLVFLRRKKL